MLPRLGRTLGFLILASVLATCSSDSDPQELTIYGPYVGVEADIFSEVLESFEDETGVSTRYVGSNSFGSDVLELITTATLPDVVVLPQPSLLERLAEVDALSVFDPEESQRIADVIGDRWASAVSSDERLLAVPYRFVVKSLIWFRADVFEDRGYDIPTTLAELQALSELMIEDGSTPWCAGMDDALATGWWATDWVEDLVLRRAGPDLYNSWAALDIPFTDEAVVGAMSDFQELIGAEGAVSGGRRAILNRSVEEAMDSFFGVEPGCLMHKQASFQPVWFPDGISFDDERVDVFPLPDVEASPPPMMVSGEVVAATSSRPGAKLFVLFLLEEEAFEPWHDFGGSLVARSTLETQVGDTSLDRRLAVLLDDAPDIVHDASDLMPREIGTDVFFGGMIDLVSGLPAEDVALNMQQAVAERVEG